MATQFTGIVLIALAVTCSAGSVVLENAAIRVEIEPKTFSVRYFGRPGGRNFLEPNYLTERQRNGDTWITPGGLTTDVLPVSDRDPAMRRGPATVVELRDDYILLMGPLSTLNPLRVKKEYHLPRDSSTLSYKLSVLSPEKTPHTVSVRITAQLQWSGQVNIPNPLSDPVRLVQGFFPDWNNTIGQPRDFLAIPLVTRAGRDRAVLRAQSHHVSVRDGDVVWTREASVTSAGESDREKIELITLVDDKSNTCQVAFEARQQGVNVGAPLVYLELWTLDEARDTITQRELTGEDDLEG